MGVCVGVSVRLTVPSIYSPRYSTMVDRAMPYLIMSSQILIF